uniref:Putative mical-like protein 1 isoform x3 n=1 Tax=Xenopsylla cheopis TaxID=163159 RepID=A0A6M2DRL7_XENCH
MSSVKPTYIPRRDKCSKCKNPVFLAERILINEKIFHRVCFSCAHCGTQLHPDSFDYYENESGDYCCESCPDNSLSSEDRTNEDRSLKSESESVVIIDDSNPIIEISSSSASTVSIDRSRIPKKDSIVLARMKMFGHNMLNADDCNSVSSRNVSDGSNLLLNNALILSKSNLKSDASSSYNIDSLCDSSKSDKGSNISSDNLSKNNLIQDSALSSINSTNDSDISEGKCIGDEVSSSNSDAPSRDDILLDSNSMPSNEEDIERKFTSTMVSFERDSILRNAVDVSFGLDTSFEIYEDISTSKGISEKYLTDANIFTISESLNEDSGVTDKTNTEEIMSNAKETEGNQVSDIDIFLEETRCSSMDLQDGINSNASDISMDKNVEKDLEVASTVENYSLDSSNIVFNSDVSVEKNLEAAINKSDTSEKNVDIKSENESLACSDSAGKSMEVLVSDNSNFVVNESIDPENGLSNSNSSESLSKNVSKTNDKQLPTCEANHEEEYPEELNPFGEEECTSDLDSSNPFFEDLVETKEPKTESNKIDTDSKHTTKTHQRRKITVNNPFWSDGDMSSSEEENEVPVPAPRSLSSVVPKASPRTISSSDIVHNAVKIGTTSPSPSKRKKQPAPKPPVQNSPSKPAARKARPAPLPPVLIISPENVHTSTPLFEEGQSNFPLKCNISDVKHSPVVSEWEKRKSDKEENNRTRKSSDGIPSGKHLNNDKHVATKFKRKKGPAPAMPVMRRSVTPLPIADIKQELEVIELQQQGLEKQGVKLEQLIRMKCEGGADITDNSTRSIETATIGMTDDEVDDLVLQLFEIVNEKNELFRRQAQLMYMRRQQRLEEEHADLEYQIRCLMAQPETNRTDSDKQLEEQLISRLLEVVTMRNEVIDCLEMDRIRAVEEDHSISSRLESYTAQREQQNDDSSSKSLQNSPVKLSKKEKKKEKEKKKLKKLNIKKQDIDKDIDESEISSESLKNSSKILKEKKKSKWFS